MGDRRSRRQHGGAVRAEGSRGPGAGTQASRLAVDQVVGTLDGLAGDMGGRRSGAGIDYSLRCLLSPVAAGPGPGSAAGCAHLGGSGSSDVRPYGRTCPRKVVELCAGGKCRPGSGDPGECRTRARLAAEHHTGGYGRGWRGHGSGGGCQSHPAAVIVVGSGGGFSRCNLSHSQDTRYLAGTESADDMGRTGSGDRMVCL